MKKAMFTYAFAKYSTVIIGLLINAVLSRILLPEDYGIAAVVTVFTTFFNVLSTMGLGTGLIQDKDLTEADTDNIYSLSVWTALVLGVFFFACASPIAFFYGDKRYVLIVRILSISIFFNAINVIPNSILLKEEKFKKVAVRMIMVSCISGGIAIVVALNHGGYYALVVQTILSIAIQFVWNRVSVKLHFHLMVDFASIMKIANYSFFQFAYSVLLYFSQNLDNLLIGKVMGSKQLAYYNKSYTVMRYPIDYIPHAISPVLHPVLSKYQNDYEYIYKKYIEIGRVMSLIGVLISLVFFWEAPEIIMILFGAQWGQSIISFRIFGLGIWVQLINALAGSIYQSTNNTKNMFYSGLIHVFITLVAIVAGIWSNDINRLAVYIVISWYVKFMVETYFLIVRSLKKSALGYLKIFLPDFSIFLITSILFGFLCRWINFNEFLSLLIKTIMIFLIFGICCLCFGKKYMKNEHEL